MKFCVMDRNERVVFEGEDYYEASNMMDKEFEETGAWVGLFVDEGSGVLEFFESIEPDGDYIEEQS